MLCILHHWWHFLNVHHLRCHQPVAAECRINRRQYVGVLDVPGDGNCPIYASCLSACFVHKIEKLHVVSQS